MVLEILLWLIVGLLALVTLFMILPVRVVMSLQCNPVRQARVLVRPFGGVSPAIGVYDSTRKSKPKAPPKTKRPQASKGKAQTKRKGKGRLRGNALAELPVLIGQVLRAIHIEVLQLDADFGLGDPAETGQLYGQLCPLIYNSAGQVTLRPDFGAASLRGSAFAQFRVIPIAIVWPFVGFAWRFFAPLR